MSGEAQYKDVILKATDAQGAFLIPFVPNATTTKAGLVKVDGTSITIDNNGVISSAGGSSSEIHWADWEEGDDPDQWVF